MPQIHRAIASQHQTSMSNIQKNHQSYTKPGQTDDLLTTCKSAYYGSILLATHHLLPTTYHPLSNYRSPAYQLPITQYAPAASNPLAGIVISQAVIISSATLQRTLLARSADPTQDGRNSSGTSLMLAAGKSSSPWGIGSSAQDTSLICSHAGNHPGRVRTAAQCRRASQRLNPCETRTGRKLGNQTVKIKPLPR